MAPVFFGGASIISPSYVPEPGQRGTLGLFWSCTTTFILCIWTAMHPNVVPVQRDSARIYYKLSIMMFAALLPEVILCVAVTQWLEARRVLRAWRAEWDKDDDFKDFRDLFGMSGAFLVVMGGFVIESNKSKSEQCDLDRALDRETVRNRTETNEMITTICPPGFITLLENGTIRDLVRNCQLTKSHFDQNNIEDKGKANNIAKAIVVCQAMWLLVQLIGRKSAGLPVTILEAHVAIQVLYSVTMYLFWWSKPLNVAMPIPIPLNEGHTQGSYLKSPSTGIFRGQSFITESQSNGTFIHMFFRATYDSSVMIQPTVEFVAVFFGIVNISLHATLWNSYFPTSIERLLWHLSAVGMGLVPLFTYLIIYKKGFEGFWLRYLYEVRFDNGPLMRQPVNIIYGFWKMYRDSSMDIPLEEPVTSGASTTRQSASNRAVATLTNESSKSEDRKAEGWPKWIPSWCRFVLMALLVLCMPLYFVSSVYLAVEAFISIRSLPAGAYSTVRWSSVFPHI
ncbi:hypothetical protein BDV40DRAFT_293432 [Aspergillus tamarii]|uniref:Uncharacterized protein n=1 Tax=Aspergillus tamarii TaxID=41984 RepID=A0A5N6UDG0_ASPTM|nr:hypothetical protein BDV40DRAFT_293432 [Aspergillus tamarii]